MYLDKMEPPPPPQMGDLLVRSDLPDWQNNACLNWGDNQAAYTEGYRRGAECLVQHVIETSSDQDFLVYPIIFLYRHHIELILKRIIGRAPYLIGRQLTDPEKNHLGCHRLDLLWQDLKPIVEAICKTTGLRPLDSSTIDGIDDYIRQLGELDRDSFSFRYAQSKKGSPSLPADLKKLNVRHFAEMMGRLTSYLEAIDSATDDIAGVKAEMEAEWRRDIESSPDYYDGY